MAGIVAFKLITGEEVIAKIIKDTELYFILEKPRTLLMTPGERGQVNLSMVPWMVCAQDPTGNEHDSKLYKSAIIGEPQHIPHGLEKGYERNVSSIQIVQG